MSKRDKLRFNLLDYKAAKEEEGAIDIDLPDGSTFRIPPPELWPDVVTKRVQAERRDAAANPYPLEEMARDIVGDKAWDHWVDQGGTAVLFHTFLKENHGADVGESSASSDS